MAACKYLFVMESGISLCCLLRKEAKYNYCYKIKKGDNKNMNIIECLQDEINKIVDTDFKSDKCKPVFIVSNLFKEDLTQNIILTIQHLSGSFSRTLFPLKDKFYGYDNLKNIIKDLYNQTM